MKEGFYPIDEESLSQVDFEKDYITVMMVYYM